MSEQSPENIANEEAESEFSEQVMRYLAGELPAHGVATIEREMLADAEKRTLFVWLCLSDALSGEVLSQEARLPDGDEEMSEWDMRGSASLNDAMIMPALVESDAADEEAILVELPRDIPDIPLVKPDSAKRLRFPDIRRIHVIGAVAAMVALGLGLSYLRISLRPVATLTASIGCVWGQPQIAPTLGKPLSSGKTLQLTRGFAEFKYPNGAKIVVESPATFILDSRERVTLLHGRLTATIPAPAHGFTVSTPAGKIVDLGTEFGVNVISDSVVQTIVFRGRIEVMAKNDAGKGALIVTAGQGAHFASTGVSLDAAPEVSQHYVRDIHQVMATFPTHGTAEGLAKGDEDPYWQITRVPNDPLWQEKAAVASDAMPFYLPSDSRSAWISTDDPLVKLDAGPYTFKTTFDLTGFNPSSAHLHLSLAADDGIEEIRLNGTTIRPRDSDVQWFRSMHSMEIQSGFIPGVNQLEIVVHNKDFSQMALKAELDGTAVRNVDAQQLLFRYIQAMWHMKRNQRLHADDGSDDFHCRALMYLDGALSLEAVSEFENEPANPTNALALVELCLLRRELRQVMVLRPRADAL